MAKTIKAATAEEASRKYLAWKGQNRRASQGEWNGHRISYNGRVWKDETCIWPPMEQWPAEWARPQ